MAHSAAHLHQRAPGGDYLRGALNTTIGVVRCFGNGDIRESGLRAGWAAPEDAHNWNDGPESLLTVAAPPTALPVILAIEGVPLILPACVVQEITLYANGLRVGFWRLREARAARLDVVIEPEYWHHRGAAGVLNLAFHLPHSLRLSSIDADGDHRELGFSFRTLALLPASNDH
jgi:hypothetical protein